MSLENTNWYEQAKAKLEAESKAGSFDKYAAIMKNAVRESLLDFANQNEEFAQAIAQGGTFTDCMKAVAKNCGQGISDLEAYSRAALFYFPGSRVRFRMEIDVIGDAAEETAETEEPESGNAVIIDISNFL